MGTVEISGSERDTIEAALVRLRGIFDELAATPAGVAVLHVEAAVAALESRLRQPDRMPA